MNKYLTILFLLLILSKLNAQQPIASNHYSIKHGNYYLFIDNAKGCWYTIELPTDTLFQVEGNMYFCDGKVMQVNAVLFSNGQDEGVRGSLKAAKSALNGHKKWELDYQEETLGKHLKSGEELFYDINGKPFLIWWYKTPKNIKNPIKEIDIQTIGSSDNNSETTAVERLITHQLFLEFVIQGNTSVAICIPVMENENIENEKQKLKTIASTLNVYGSYIDLDILEQRTNNKGKFFLEDSLKLIKIEVPDWLNILKVPIDNCYFGSFPEKENIYNAVGISWTYKSDSMDFQKFVAYYQKRKKRENDTIISDDGNLIREFYTSNNAYFHCQDVYIESDNLYCHVNFTATRSTYDFNIERFKELLTKIKLK